MSKPGLGWKQKAVREVVEYWINFFYLAMFLGLFAWYRRLILAEYRISYLNFFAFIPFFAFRELGRVLGEGELRRMFFRSGTAVET